MMISGRVDVGRRCALQQYALLCLCLLFLSTSAGAQSMGPPGFEPPYAYNGFSPSLAIIVVVLIAALFFMGFFSIYIRHCTDSTSRNGGGIQAVLSMRSRRAARGLDAAVIETFPTFEYSEVKTLKIGKGALECAVCLNEFEDDEKLRLLPKCDHVFHPECIDAWLQSHVTCPVCRANLVPAADESNHFHLPDQTQASDHDNNGNNPTELETRQNADVSIQVRDDDEVNDLQQLPPRPPRPPLVNRNFSFDQSRPPRSKSVRTRVFSKFRLNSTGHSLVRAGENLERFTLRLPDEVRKEVMSRAMLNRTGSLTAMPTEESSRRGYRTGEGSSRGRSYRRFESLERLRVKSDRWGFFSRWPSVKSPKVGTDGSEGSTSSRTPKGVSTTVKLPFNCLEPKSSDETGLVAAADLGRSPV